MTETTWTWLLFGMELVGVAGSYLVGNNNWRGHMIIALHSFPWFIYALIFDKPGFIAMWVLWQWVHWRNMHKWLKDKKLVTISDV
jgi:hypothetical protein